MPSSSPKMTSKPDFHFERVLMKAHNGLIAGIDEAGRGPWSGPVVAAAVIFEADNTPDGLDDSKKLSAERRSSLFEAIYSSGKVGVAIASVERIDQDNILQATLWAMAQAFHNLADTPAAALIDGNFAPKLAYPCKTLIKGDGRSLSIAAASIIAKVTRDRIMIELAKEFPGYGWERNKGYGTAEHRDGLDRLGVTPHHRRSFRPVKIALENAAEHP